MLAAQAFDVFLTVDQRLPRQHALAEYRLGFLIVQVKTNRLESFAPVLDELRQGIDRVRPGEILHIPQRKA